jgi:hypothetical protein
MQTLDRPAGSELDLPDARPRRRGLTRLIAAAVVTVIACATIGYAAGSSRSQTKTVVKTVTVSPSTAAPRNCVPGAGAGSCNADEFAALQIPDQPLDAATRANLAQELVTARAAALRYPTVADAKRAHLLQAGTFSPETGAHYINISGALGPFDPANPGSYIYDGVSPTSKLIGLMYLSGSAAAPEGFAGPNDHWHRHFNTCVIYTAKEIVVPFAADSDVKQSQCDRVHGTFMRRTTWMVHAWVVPGWESPSGVFAHDNANIRCADGTIKADAAGFCQGT